MNRVLSAFIFFAALFILLPSKSVAKSNITNQIDLLNEEIDGFVLNKKYAEAVKFCNTKLHKIQQPDVRRYLLVQKLRLFVKSGVSVDSIPIIFQQQKKIENEDDSLRGFLNARSTEILGHYYFKKRNYQKSIALLNVADSLYAKTTAYENRVYNLNMLGTINQYAENQAEALFALLKADQILENHIPNDSALEIDLHIDIGMAYFNLRRYDKALEYYLSISKYELSPKQNAQALNNLGIIHLEKGDYKLALIHIKAAIDLYKKQNALLELGRGFNNYASALEKSQAPEDSILFYYNESLRIKAQLGDTVGMISTDINLASFFFKREQYEKVEEILFRFYGFSEYFSLQDFASSNYMLSVIAKRNGDSQKALAYFELFHAYNDSLQTQENDWHLARDELEKEIDKKQNRIDLLRKEQSLADVTSSKQRIIIVAISVVSVTLIVVLALLTTYYYKKQRLENRLRNRDVKLSSISSLVKGQEDERLRMAKDLHDGVGNNLAIIRATVLKDFPDERGKHLAQLVTQTSEEVRSITHDLMPVAIRKFGLKEALSDLAKKWKESANLMVDVNYTGLPLATNKDVALTVFRILQELINNSYRHGKADYVVVKINQLAEEMHLVYEDNGIGMSKSVYAKSSGMGIKNIKNRVEYLNGTVKFFSDANGVTISFIFRKPKHENPHS